MIIANVWMELFDPRHQVAFHDLNMINIKENFHALGTDLAAYFGRHLDLVAEIIRVALHLDIDAGIEHFETKSDLFLLGMSDDLFQSVHHVFHPFFVGNAATEAGESNDVRESGCGRIVNALAEDLQTFGMLFLMNKTFGD